MDGIGFGEWAEQTGLDQFFLKKNEEEGEEEEAQVEEVVWLGRLGGSVTIIKLHCIKFSKNPQKCKKVI